MGLSSSLIDEFVKVTNDSTQEKQNSSTVQGTLVIIDGKSYMRIDGSDLLTPISTTASGNDGDRVIANIEDHKATVTGNLTSPSATTESVREVGTKIDEFEIIISGKVVTEDLEVVNAAIENLKAISATLTNAEIINAQIETLEAKYANLDHVTATDVEALNAEIEKLKATFGEFTDISTEDLEAAYAEIDTILGVNATFTYVSTEVLDAVQADIKTLYSEKITVKDIEGKYANIDFGNIGQLAVENFFAKSGLIEDVVVGDQTVTGRLVGVTISGDLIEANTLKADKLVILGDDGLYYKLNLNALGETVVGDLTEEEQEALKSGIHGTNILANSITAEKIAVDDLVAFDAKIAGFELTDGSLYSGVKSSIDNTTRGIFMDNTGQFVVGNASNFIKFYHDEETDTWQLEISAAKIKMGGSNKTIEEELDEIEVGGRNLLLKSDFSGLADAGIYTFDGDEVTFSASDVGTTSGVSFTVSLSDYGASNLRNNTITFSMDYKVTSELTYGTTQPWVGAQLGVIRDDSTGGSSQWLSWYGNTTIPTAVMDDWDRTSVTWTITDYDFTSTYISFYLRDTSGTIMYRHPKLEISNITTDWTLAPEDVEEDIDDVQSSASEAITRADDAWLEIDSINATISALVTGQDGESLMTQTDTGWTFSLASVLDVLNTLETNLDDTTNTLNTTNKDVAKIEEAYNTLNQAVSDLGEYTDYIKFGVDENSQPCIILGETDSDFKVVITNTAIKFMEGSDVPAYISNKKLNITNANVNGELKQTNSNVSGGFIWAVRENGNYGLLWKGE